jgi:hypothetical protein
MGNMSSVALESQPQDTADALFATVEAWLKASEAETVEDSSIRALRDRVHRNTLVQRRLDALNARCLARMVRIEEEATSDLPFESATRWLQSTFQVPSNAAYAQVRTAHTLENLPATAQALQEGKIGPQQAAAICHSVDRAQKTRLEPGLLERNLLRAAATMDGAELKREFFRLQYQADQAASVAAEDELYKRRWLNLWRPSYSEKFKLEAELDPETGCMLRTALHALMGKPASDDDRNPAQRRHDALRELAKRALDSGALPELGGEKPHLFVLANLETLQMEPGSRLAQLDWGIEVTGETAGRIACDASITPVRVDSEGTVEYVGRSSRTVPPKMRKALNVRDRHCQHEGCDVDAHLCEPHHIIPVWKGGKTKLWNLTLRCERHHRFLHPENHRFYGRCAEHEDASCRAP